MIAHFLCHSRVLTSTVVLVLFSFAIRHSECGQLPAKLDLHDRDRLAQRSPSVVANDGLQDSSILYSLLSETAATTKRTQASSECLHSLGAFYDGINGEQLWAIKALDASGTPRHSFVWGQNAWLGSHRECQYLNEAPSYSLTPELRRTANPSLLSALAPIRMEMRMIFANVTSSNRFDSITYYNMPHRIGLCLPASCTNSEIKRLIQTTFTDRPVAIQRLMDISVAVTVVRTLSWSNFLQRNEVWWILASIAGVAAIVIGCSGLYDVIADRPKSQLTDILKCFSLRINAQALFSTGRPSQSQIGSINGIRTIVCFWILVIHVSFFSMFAYDNLPALFQMLDTVVAQPVFAAIFYVDSFFVVSAMLLVTNFLGDAKKMETVRRSDTATNARFVFRHICHRYTRLTPAFLFTIAISQVLSIYLRESSSLYVDSKFELYCTANGLWRSLLYIHNLFPVTEMCAAWTWYLACDMQFYVLVLVLLFIYAKHPKTAIVLFCGLTLSVCAVCLSIMLSLDMTIRIDSVFKNFVHIYTVPWMRVGPYLAGSAAGFALFHANASEPKIITKSPAFVRAYWTVATLAFLCSLFTAYEKPSAGGPMFAIVASQGRLLLGLFVSSVIVACSLQAGGWLNRFLSASVFVHLNRITYFGYLLNPVVTVALQGFSDSSAHFDIPSTVTMVCSVTVITYVASVVSSLVFEMPFQRLSDIYIMQKGGQMKATK